LFVLLSDVDTVSLFKARLDKFRMLEDVKYDFDGRLDWNRQQICTHDERIAVPVIQ